jgi:hypothetical protein
VAVAVVAGLMLELVHLVVLVAVALWEMLALQVEMVELQHKATQVELQDLVTLEEKAFVSTALLIMAVAVAVELDKLAEMQAALLAVAAEKVEMVLLIR